MSARGFANDVAQRLFASPAASLPGALNATTRIFIIVPSAITVAMSLSGEDCGAARAGRQHHGRSGAHEVRNVSLPNVSLDPDQNSMLAWQ